MIPIWFERPLYTAHPAFESKRRGLVTIRVRWDVVCANVLSLDRTETYQHIAGATRSYRFTDGSLAVPRESVGATVNQVTDAMVRTLR